MEPLPQSANSNNLLAVWAILNSNEFTQQDLNLALARAVLRFKERAAIARVLLDYGANPNGNYGAECGPIVFVTGEALDPDGLQFLIEAGADVTFAPIDTKYGKQCPLSSFLGTYLRGHNAAKHRGIKMLLDRGAFVPPEVTAPMLAIHTGEAELLGTLLDADPTLITQKFANMPYGNMSLRGATLLHAAAEFDEMDCVIELLKRGARVNTPADVMHNAGGQTPIFHAAYNARVDVLLKLLGAEADVNAADHKQNTPLSHVCISWADASNRIAAAKLLIDHGAAVRQACENHLTALHGAAVHGPVAMVELLLRAGAKEWQADKDGKKPIDYARAGTAADKDAIIELLDRPVIRDPVFKLAVKAMHTGNLASLQIILHDHPQLVHEHAIEPDCYPPSYFGNPKLLWFVANNPTLIDRMPDNISQICEVIIQAGASAEDLDYTLGLVMTSTPARVQGHQNALMKVLLDHGAKPGDLMAVLAHCELEPVKFLLANRFTLTAPVAAALGRNDELEALLTHADAATTQSSFGVAVINRQVSAARLCLAAGAEVNAFLPVHSHSRPVHQAAVNDDVEMLRLLVEYDAKLDVRDALWNSTPLGWAVHTGKQAAEVYLRSVGAS